MEPEFQQANQRSSEEDAELEKSVRKDKEKVVEPNRSQASYKDRLVGDIPGAYAQAFCFDKEEEAGDEADSDTELDELVEGMVDVKLTKETKARIRAPWNKALIVKVYGKTVGYSYLTFKINTLWKPVAKMVCVDLGKDFFLIKFSDKSDYDKVLQGGPWFVGEHFLAIKPWEPYFKASEASFSSVAVWIRFPELPIEFYDPMVLREIGSAIGPVLRIDSYTASGSRASFARLCVQIDLSKPLVNLVRMGRLRQKVMYEGISALCFCCGRLGHKQECCGYRVRPMEKNREEGPSEKQKVQQNERDGHSEQSVQSDSNFGDWMIVTRRKNSVRMGRNRGTKSPHQQTSAAPKESKGKEVKSSPMPSPNTEVSFQFQSGHVKRAVGASDSSEATLTSSKSGEIRTQAVHGDGHFGNQVAFQKPFNHDLGTPSSQTTILRNKKAKLSKAGREKRSPSSSSAKTLKRANPEPDSCFKPSALASDPCSHGFSLPNPPFTSHGGVGNLVQEQVDSHSRGADCSNPCSPNGINGSVRRGSCDSLEAHLPNHPEQCKNRESSPGSSYLGQNPKSMVEVHNRHAVDLRKGSAGVEHAKAAISSATLGRIGMACPREESDRFQGIGINASGEYAYVKVVPDSQPGQEMRSSGLLQRRDSGDIELSGGVEAGLGSVQGSPKETGMEHDCISNDGD